MVNRMRLMIHQCSVHLSPFRFQHRGVWGQGSSIAFVTGLPCHLEGPCVSVIAPPRLWAAKGRSPVHRCPWPGW